MESRIKKTIPRALRYLFLGLTCLWVVISLLDLFAFVRFDDHGPAIRGWVTTTGDYQHTVVPHPDGSGDMKMYNWGERKFVMLEFRDMKNMLQLRYLGFILLQVLKNALIIFVLYQMYRIFRNLDLGKAFRDEHIRRVRLIALSVFLFPIASQMASRTLTGITYEVEGHLIQTAMPPLLGEQLMLGALLSLVLLGLAEVFRSGAWLQHEQDLTI